MGRVYIVTGANGFLGSNLIRKLLDYGESEIRALVLPGESVGSLEGLSCDIYYGDVTRPETLDELFRISDDKEPLVIHCAAVVYIKSKENPRVYDVNVNGTKNIVEKTLAMNAKLVYVSSVHAIPEKPENELITEICEFDPQKVVGQYAKTKAEAADYVLKTVQTRNLNACIVHPSGIIGPGDYGSSHLTQLMIDFAKGRLTACVKGGYDFVDVRDVADGIISACDKGIPGECYLLTNRYVEVKELLDLISEARNMKKIKTVLPMWFAELTVPLSELYYAVRKQPPLYTRVLFIHAALQFPLYKRKGKKRIGI